MPALAFHRWPERAAPCQVIAPCTENLEEEEEMPVIILWAVPVVVVLGGGIYLIGHHLH
jgi:hypothetical protein